MMFSFNDRNYRRLTMKEKTDAILKRSQNREYFFSIAVKMLSLAHQRSLRLIMENPWSEQTFLKSNFVAAPTLVDKNRLQRGDYFSKPTAYWFVNAEPTHGFTEQRDKKKKTVYNAKQSKQAGVCSEERSMISPDYARNFICDFIIGKEQIGSQLNLFQ